MKTRLSLCVAVCVGSSLMLATGCRSVSDGPVLPADPNQRAIIYGKEPQHAPIPQKDVPPGESSLEKKAPDTRIDQPKR